MAFDELKIKGRVHGAKLKPDLVWVRGDAGNKWRKVVVDVKITSTDKMDDAFKEDDDRYRGWATGETLEKNDANAVMVPIIISHDGAIHRDSVKQLKDFASDMRWTV